MLNYRLSKSNVLSGVQCPKRLYLEAHKPELLKEGGSLALKRFMGYQAGEAAKTLFSDGELIEYEEDISGSLKKTEALLNEYPGRALFEAAFQHKGIFVRSDIFISEEDGFRLIEVKSSTSIKDYYLLDCAVQAWVIDGAGYPLERVELAYVNNSFVYKGDHDYEGMFILEDFTEAIIPIKERIPKWLERFQSILEGDIPETEVGVHCKYPFYCPFQSFCNSKEPEYPVTILPNAHSTIIELLSKGIEDVRDIPEGCLVKDIHKKIRRITVSGKPELVKDAGEYLSSLPYPRYYLDFETIAFAAPIWPGTHPYQQLPFQWSCHREDESGDLSHFEFLDISGKAPMHNFILKLLDTLGGFGPVFVYNKAFEKRILLELSSLFPDLSGRNNLIINRLVDLLPLVRKYYYHPQMKGSWSIKSVLPTIDPVMDYKNLDEIQNGVHAQTAYLEAINPGTSGLRRSILADRMLEYCNMDTLALVKLVNFLEGRL